jgi:hypothetical protein
MYLICMSPALIIVGVHNACTYFYLKTYLSNPSLSLAVNECLIFRFFLLEWVFYLLLLAASVHPLKGGKSQAGQCWLRIPPPLKGVVPCSSVAFYEGGERRLTISRP